jgi:hypothetical protein
MGTFLERVGKGLKTICGCFSVAMQQARQSEIDVLSRRSFRERNGLGDPSPVWVSACGLSRAAVPRQLGLPKKVKSMSPQGGSFTNCRERARTVLMDRPPSSRRRSYTRRFQGRRTWNGESVPW